MKRRRILLLTAALTASTFTTVGTVDAAFGRCTRWEPLLTQEAPKGGWNVAKMSRTMMRESRCQPSVVNRRGGDTGLLQIHPVTWPWLSTHFGVTVTRTLLQDPTFNIKAAAALCSYWRKATGSPTACYRPWRGGA